MYCIGLTGNIASGKSTVAGFFSSLGIEIISADDLAKALTASTEPGFHAIVHHFGPSIVTPAGDLDRRQLRQIIFKHPNERLWLEAYLHPLIRAAIIHQLQNISSPYCVIEIPLLTDRKNYPYLDRVLLIQADPEQQLARCAARDNSSKENALTILNTQLKAHLPITLADDILINTGSLEDLKENVTALHIKYLKHP